MSGISGHNCRSPLRDASLLITDCTGSHDELQQYEMKHVWGNIDRFCFFIGDFRVPMSDLVV